MYDSEKWMVLWTTLPTIACKSTVFCIHKARIYSSVDVSLCALMHVCPAWVCIKEVAQWFSFGSRLWYTQSYILAHAILSQGQGDFWDVHFNLIRLDEHGLHLLKNGLLVPCNCQIIYPPLDDISLIGLIFYTVVSFLTSIPPTFPSSVLLHWTAYINVGIQYLRVAVCV